MLNYRLFLRLLSALLLCPDQNLTVTMTPEDVSDTLKVARGNFFPISVKSKYYNLLHLR